MESSELGNLSVRRCFVNGKTVEVFRETCDAYLKDYEAAMKRRRKNMDNEWKEIEEGWNSVEKRMEDIGLRRAGLEDSLLSLDVGGSLFDVWRPSLYKDLERGPSTLTALFEGVWDKRLPRLTNGRIVIDESPSCFNRLMKIQLGNERSGDVGQAEPLEKHDQLYLKHLASSLRIVMSSPRDVVTIRGSASLKVEDALVLSSHLRHWPSEVWTTPSMRLLYRASVGGSNTALFHARCGHAAPTIMIITVHSVASENSIIGAFTRDPWTPPSSGDGPNLYKRSADTFIFLLKDGQGSAPAERWPTQKDSTMQRGRSKDGVFFRCCPTHANSCHKDPLRVNFFDTLNLSETQKYLGSIVVEGGACCFGNSHSANAFRALNGARILECEVFSELVLSQASGVRRRPPETSQSDMDTADQRSFGVTIASCLMRERRALKAARAELESAGAKIESAAEALRTVYGPHVAAGVEDSVVELNVRGKALTTLRSTLRACPESALAIRFDEKRWPAQDQDRDEKRRYLVDCCPLCFGKVLDVLRILKRLEWNRISKATNKASSTGEASVEPKIGKVVDVPRAHQECFASLVGMYFPGREELIMKVVDSSFES